VARYSVAAVTVLETRRLRLRPLTTADADLWVALHADDRVNRFVGSYTRQAALARLERVEEQWSARGHNLFAIERRDTGEFVGRGGLNYWDAFDEVEAGWTLRADAWGKGYATEAARAFIAWGFRTLSVPYLTAMIRHGNDASVHVAEHLGFTPGRDDVLLGHPVVVYVLDRPS